MTRQPDSPEPLSAEERVRAFVRSWDAMRGGSPVIYTLMVGPEPLDLTTDDILTTLDAARSAIPAAEGLDVERLARAMESFYGKRRGAFNVTAPAIAAEYARLAPTQAPETEG